MTDDDWDERYRSGSYAPRADPSDLLVEYLDWLPEGAALDVATGNGRNAIYLAEHGYDVDALDISAEALRLARDRAPEAVDANWIEADYERELPDRIYDVIVMSFVRPVSYPRFTDVTQRLAPGGVLVHEHHVTRAPPPSGEADWQWRSNDLLGLCTDLTVVHYGEAERTYENGERAGQTDTITTLVAKNTTGGIESYPPELPIGTR